MRKISIKFHLEAKPELAIITFMVIFEYIKLEKKKKAHFFQVAIHFHPVAILSNRRQETVLVP